MQIPQIFDRNLYRRKRDNIVNKFKKSDFIHRYIADDLSYRLQELKRTSGDILILGYTGNSNLQQNKNLNIIETDISYNMVKLSRETALVVDEELLPFNINTFDIIYTNLVLQTVNDLPGCFAQINNCLKDKGIFIGSMFGNDTLKELKQALVITESELCLPHSPHIFPFIDIKDLGSLLQRAKFTLPVVDKETVTVYYNDVYSLLNDLKHMGLSNILHARSKKYLGKNFFTTLNKNYKLNFVQDHEKIIASFDILKFLGSKN
jgi:SAM-dependent methyltransferase